MAAEKETQLLIRREMARRTLDTTMVDVYVSHGVVYLRGTVRAIRGQNTDLKQEVTNLLTVLKQKSGIRDVVNELQIR
jgi:osmotically-inducible protein OsmY